MSFQKIAVIIFLITGSLSLIASIYLGNTVLALIGVGLVFWGVLFLLLGPLRQVEDSILYDTASSEYSTINRVINDLKCTGEALYMPPHSKDTQTPDGQKQSGESVVFISPRKPIDFPSLEERVGGKFLLKDRKGVLLIPPGLGILNDIEKKLKIDFTGMDPMQFCQIISNVLLEKLNLANEIETMQEDTTFKFKIRNSAYKTLYTQKDCLTSVHLLGCPLVSAIAVGLAKASRKNVGIVNENVSEDNSIVEVWYRLYN
jgi:hypothetical protein